MDFKLHNGSGGLSYKGISRPTNKLNTYDWLADVPGNIEDCDMVEVQFKNTRKGYYKNSNKIDLKKGDVVAVEANPGHDIGVVTLTGRLVNLQMKKSNGRPNTEIKRVYRIAKPVDLEKYEEAKSREHSTMIKSRQIAARLNLDMKIGDVEYQGDGNKAIFYYIADERVDFRQLIKDLAGEFRIRIEMKQIGARQEAGRIGGIGPCGRELCCASWMRNFVSVSTNAARIQDISLNPQKLAGQCAKLKCCLNYEVDAYVEAQKKLPSREVTLETKDGTYYFFKADILNNEITYSSDKVIAANLITISAKKAFDIIHQNRRGKKPDILIDLVQDDALDKPKDILEQESVTRFDKSKKIKKRPNRRNNNKRPDNRPQNTASNQSENEDRNRNQRRNNNKPERKQENNRQENRQENKQENPQGNSTRNTKKKGRRPYNRRRSNNNQEGGNNKSEQK
ncbi:regulatory iron-sulfur-containing complex subunit RicT [Bacteroides sp.]|uniref:PSP1 domain-containing protein n=1 Tax=Bacteroides sp. TaxID=29523 RepID=UPI00258FDB13|nr:regulatory iron-sulfur-containing complex subunit RicT [Bacteroides sp.]